MRIKTIGLFAAGYFANEYAVFGAGIEAIPAEFRAVVLLFTIALVFGLLFDRYAVGPWAKARARSQE